MTTLDHEEKLRALVRENTALSPEGFAVDLQKQPAAWYEAVTALGQKRAYPLMARELSQAYREAFGREYLFSEPCLAFELRYHVNAYLRAMGFRGLRRHVTTLLFSRDSLIRHCRVVDISTDDVKNFRQRTMFRYRRGIRPCYRGTEADPFRASRRRR